MTGKELVSVPCWGKAINTSDGLEDSYDEESMRFRPLLG